MKRNQLILSLLLLIPSLKVNASNCFKHHLVSSLNINKERKRDYALLSNGQSNKVFRELILSEKLSIPVSMYFDLRAKKYQKRGINLLCDEFKDMEIRDIQLGPALPKRTSFNWRYFQAKIRRGVKLKDEKIIKDSAMSALKMLDAEPHYHCFSRHILESIYRFAYFIPLRVAQAQSEDMKSPKKLLLQLISLQNISLKFASRVDRLSAPLQEKGIPVLCSELPNLIDDLQLD